MRHSDLPIIYVLGPSEMSARPERVSTARSMAMLLGGPYKKLVFTAYGSVGKTKYWRVESSRRGIVGFFVSHGFDWISRPTDHEHSCLQTDAARFARYRAEEQIAGA